MYNLITLLKKLRQHYKPTMIKHNIKMKYIKIQRRKKMSEATILEWVSTFPYFHI